MKVFVLTLFSSVYLESFLVLQLGFLVKWSTSSSSYADVRRDNQKINWKKIVYLNSLKIQKTTTNYIFGKLLLFFMLYGSFSNISPEILVWKTRELVFEWNTKTKLILEIANLFWEISFGRKRYFEMFICIFSQLWPSNWKTQRY